MKYFWKPILMACMLLGVLTACSDDNGEVVVDMLPKLRPITLTVEQQQMRDNNNEFACRLFHTINEQKGGDSSVIVSPISVTYMLGMLNTGADGQTRQQITDVLGLGGTVQEINEYCKELPRYKRPKQIIFAEVPRNATGKIEKPALRKKYGAEFLVAQQNRS